MCLAALRPLPFPSLFFVSADWSRRRSREAKRSEEVKRILSPTGIVFSVGRAGAKAGVLVKVLQKKWPENRSNGSKVNGVIVDGTQLLPTLWKKSEVAHYIRDRSHTGMYIQL